MTCAGVSASASVSPSFFHSESRRTRSVTGSSSLAMIASSVARSGGVFWYTTISASTPSSSAMLTALLEEFQ